MNESDAPRENDTTPDTGTDYVSCYVEIPLALHTYGCHRPLL